MKDSVNLVIVQGVLEVLVLCIMVKVVIESRVIDGIYINVVIGLEKGFPEEEIVSLDVCSVSRIQAFQPVARLRDGQGLSDPIDGGVHGTEPRESEDDILTSTAYDVEEMFLGNPFDVYVKGAGIVDCTSFVCGLVHIVNCNGESKLFSGEAVFSDKLPVNAGDVGTGVYQCGGVDDF